MTNNFINTSNSTFWSNLQQSKSSNVIIYNSLEFTRTQYQKINVPIKNIAVFDSQNNTIKAEVHEALSFGEYHYSLFFKATVPPLGYSSYRIEPINNQNDPKLIKFIPKQSKIIPKKQNKKRNLLTSRTMSNEYLSLSFDSNTGRLQSLTNLMENKEIEMIQSMIYYLPSNQSQTSGAYIFRPQANLPPVNLSISSFHFIDGDLVKELQLIFNESSITQVIRLYTGLDNIMGNYLDIEMHVGPIQVFSEGKEVKKNKNFLFST